MTDKYAVFGNPVVHSRSPQIHRAFAAAIGQDLSYEKQLVAIDGFEAAADEFFTAGGRAGMLPVKLVLVPLITRSNS